MSKQINHSILAIAIATMTTLAAVSGAMAQAGGNAGGGGNAGENGASGEGGGISRPQPLILTHVPNRPRTRLPAERTVSEHDCGYDRVGTGRTALYVKRDCKRY